MNYIVNFFVTVCPACSYEFLDSNHNRDGRHTLKAPNQHIDTLSYFVDYFECPTLSAYASCPKCHHIWEWKPSDKSKKTKKSYLEERKNSKVPPLSEMSMSGYEVLEYLIKEKRFDIYEEKKLLILYWAAVNNCFGLLHMHKYNFDEHSFNKPNGKDKARLTDRLIFLLNKDNVVERVLMAEIFRIGSRFMDSLKLLEIKTEDEQLQEVINTITNGCKMQNNKPIFLYNTEQIMY